MSKVNNRKTKREEMEARIIRLEGRVELLEKRLQQVGRMAGAAYSKDIRY